MDTNLLLELRKFLAPEIVYGIGALSLSGRHALNLGATRVLVVSDPGVVKAGLCSKVEKALSDARLEYVTFTSITENPKDYEVMDGAQLYLDQGCDLIVAVGGGSPMDCAKGIGIVVTNPGHITEYEGVDEVINPVPPLIFIPTTAGTSADVSQFAIINDTLRSVKIAIISKMVIPDIALVDPEATLTMDRPLTAATGMDALSHAIEAYVSTASSPLTDMAALRAVELIRDNLIKAFGNPNNLEYRKNMMMASLMAGLAFSNASLGLVHSMAHSLGGNLGLPHGECNGALLEKVVDFNFNHATAKYGKLTQAFCPSSMGKVQITAEPLVAAISKMKEQLEISMHLRDLGVQRSDLGRLALFAHNDPCLATNPRTASVDEIENIYAMIYE